MDIAHRQQAAAALLRRAGVLPVVTVDDVDQALRVGEALLDGGLHTIELTLRTPAALDALAALKRELPAATVGAGSVLSPELLRQAIDAGADFIVTPGTPPALAEALALAPLPVVPGGATATEFMALAAHGFRSCKLFPAMPLGGIPLLRALAGPLPQLLFCPTGGIHADNAADFLALSNVACVGGSWMVPMDWLREARFGRVRTAALHAAGLRDARDARDAAAITPVEGR